MKRRIQVQEGKNDPHKKKINFMFWKCWMFSLESWRLKERVNCSWIKKIYFLSCKFLSIFGQKKLWIRQCCGTVTINYGSGSGSDFWKVLVPVLTFEKFWFRFQLLKSYGSGSYFWKSYGSGSRSISRPFKANFSKKNLEFSLYFYLVSCFTRKKFINFNKFMVKCKWKKCLMKEIKYII